MVDSAAAELTDGQLAVESVLANAHIDHLLSLTESQEGNNLHHGFC